MGTLKTSSHQQKKKHENLKQAVQGCKASGLRKNLSEIASVAGMHERSAQNHKEAIEKYWAEESVTPNEDKDFIRRRGIEIGIKEMFKSEENTLEEMFGVILGTYLKVDTSLLRGYTSLKEVRTVGRHLIKVFKLTCSYKHDKGVPVHSNNRSAKYITQLKDKDMLEKLFIRSRYYEVDKIAKRWKATELLREYIKKSIKELLSRLVEIRDRELVYLYPHMYPQNGAKTTHQTIIYNNINNIEIKIADLKSKSFELNSVFNLLLRTVKVTKTSIFVPIIHEASTNEAFGRSYNVFCRLRSKERLDLGYISYDMNAALQTISLGLIKAKEKDYPVLWRYTTDKEHKKKIRREIAQALNITENGVKAKLTAFANGSVSDIKLHAYYEAFQEESDRLRRAVLKHIDETEPEVLERAREQSRRELPEELDWQDIESKETLAEIRNKSSVFFFAWTWYERKVRKAMLTVLTDGIEVHDAVYSKIDINPRIVEQKIYDQTEFNIVIEKEKP